ncbi:hypothetical protein P700755_001106 [Psychroflexus torquis ATCC 700755]|uniref:Uncharacterized protein n=1 Tax=Psychroflexus torquis (strain ATCC 700755 / CIP 106069 / ACAM 623) TaxID=313595 RepID=K4IRJ1_PSYTT|nr:hypothetical protein P700755_001106 [Psychroflexus torquis ATCC 700755]
MKSLSASVSYKMLPFYYYYWLGGKMTYYSANILVSFVVCYDKGTYIWDTNFLVDYGINKIKNFTKNQMTV